MLGMLSLATATPIQADGYPAEWEYTGIDVVDQWTSFGGRGSDLIFDLSPDGSRIVLAGYVRTGDIRVMERDMIPVQELHTPGFVEYFKGVRWSPGNSWIIEWGLADGDDYDSIVAWDAQDLVRVHPAFIDSTDDLVYMQDVVFLEGDRYVAVSGILEMGESVVRVVETADGAVVKEWDWPDNALVTSMRSDGGSLICFDETGNITSYAIDGWSMGFTIVGDGSAPVLTTDDPPGDGPWMLAYETWDMDVWLDGLPVRVDGSVLAEHGPPQGISWAFADDADYIVMAVNRLFYGSTIAVHPLDRLRAGDWYNGTSFEATLSNVTCMKRDPTHSGMVWVGLENGTLIKYQVSLLDDRPPEIVTRFPEERGEYNDTFYATWRIWDDHTEQLVVRVRLDDGPWQDAGKDIEYDDYSFYVNASNLSDGKHTLTVEARDVRQTNTTTVVFFVPSVEEGGWDGSVYVLGFALALAIVSMVALIAVGRRIRAGNDGVV